MLQSSEQKNHFFPEIEGLRAIAVIIVILFHAEISVFSGGFVGVDAFFVISGFLITSLLLREQNKKSKIDLGTFFARRAKRLLPASFFVTIVTMLAFSQVYSALEIKMLTSSAIASLVYLSNIWFASISTDYLQGGADAASEGGGERPWLAWSRPRVSVRVSASKLSTPATPVQLSRPQHPTGRSWC